MFALSQRQPLKRVLLAVTAALCGTAMIAGCGGSSSAPKIAAHPGRYTPGQSNADVIQTGHAVRATSKDDLTKTSARAFNPCQLVTLHEAQAITGGAISSKIEAPLGPTCIYKSVGATSEITVTIESTTTRQLKRQLAALPRRTVGSHVGYCGRLGSSMLFVPLSGGRLLHVTAACGIARQFALKALPRLTA